jgi:hypothetical protein
VNEVLEAGNTVAALKIFSNELEITAEFTTTSNGNAVAESDEYYKNASLIFLLFLCSRLFFTVNKAPLKPVFFWVLKI